MRTRATHLGLAALLFVAGCLALAACGSTTQVATGGTGAPRVTTGTITAQTPGATSSQTPAAPTATVAYTPTPGKVALTLSKQHYATDETVAVVVYNGLSTSISTTDHHASCTLVEIQRQTASGWQMVGKCLLMTPTRLVTLAAGSATEQRLGPSGGQTSASAWQPGTYRIAFSYTSGAADSGGTAAGAAATGGQTVYSAVFTIG